MENPKATNGKLGLQLFVTQTSVLDPKEDEGKRETSSSKKNEPSGLNVDEQTYGGKTFCLV